MLNEDIGKETGPDRVDLDEDYLSYLPSRVLTNLKTNKSMRQGFVNLWDHIATCLEGERVPSQRNVLDVVNSDNEWPPATKNFLQRGGTVESVFLAICKDDMEQGEWTGDGFYQELYGQDISNLPECRNDLEFGYVSGQCGYRRISSARYVDMMNNTLDEDGNIITPLF